MSNHHSVDCVSVMTKRRCTSLSPEVWKDGRINNCVDFSVDVSSETIETHRNKSGLQPIQLKITERLIQRLQTTRTEESPESTEPLSTSRTAGENSPTSWLTVNPSSLLLWTHSFSHPLNHLLLLLLLKSYLCHQLSKRRSSSETLTWQLLITDVVFKNLFSFFLSSLLISSVCSSSSPASLLPFSTSFSLVSVLLHTSFLFPFLFSFILHLCLFPLSLPSFFLPSTLPSFSFTSHLLSSLLLLLPPLLSSPTPSLSPSSFLPSLYLPPRFFFLHPFPSLLLHSYFISSRFFFTSLLSSCFLSSPLPSFPCLLFPSCSSLLLSCCHASSSLYLPPCLLPSSLLLPPFSTLLVSSFFSSFLTFFPPLLLLFLMIPCDQRSPNRQEVFNPGVDTLLVQ